MTARSTVTSMDPNRWTDLFERRSAQILPTDRIPVGPRDRDPALRRVLRLAAFYELIGVDVLRRNAAEEPDVGIARCLEHQARETARQVEALCELAGSDRPEKPPLAIRWPAWLARLKKPLPEQTLVTIMVQSVAIAIYDLLADELSEGRVSETLRLIADDGRFHLGFTTELMVQLIAGLPRRRIRRLARLRTLLIASLIVPHGLAHARILGPVLRASRAYARARIVSQIEHSLSRIPELALPRGA